MARNCTNSSTRGIGPEEEAAAAVMITDGMGDEGTVGMIGTGDGANGKEVVFGAAVDCGSAVEDSGVKTVVGTALDAVQGWQSVVVDESQ